MDISLAAIDVNTNVCRWAGANNPLYIITNYELGITNKISDSIKLYELDEVSTIKLYELRPDKMPIGIHYKMKPFTTKEVTLSKGDMLYFFSDGYADQFGGKNGKKFKYQSFQKILLEISHKPLPEQKEILETTIVQWMNYDEQDPYDQIDDITVMGVRI